MVNYSSRTPGLKSVALKTTPLSGIAAKSEEAASTAGQSLDRLATAFSSLGTQAGQIADQAAVAEGRRAGAVAGGEAGFEPLRTSTLYAQAYDAAGMKNYSYRVETEARGKMMEAAVQYGGDPAAMKAATDKIRTGYSGLARDAMPELAGEIDTTLQRLADGYVFQSSRDFRDRQDRNEKESFVVAQARRTADAQRLAVGGGTAENIGRRLETEVSRIEADIDARTDLGPAAKAKLKEQTRSSVLGSMLQGQVETITTLDDLGKRRDAYKAAWAAKSGDFAQLSPDGYEEGLRAFDRRQAALLRDARERTRQTTLAVDEVKERVLRGESIDPERMQMTRAVAMSHDTDGSAARQLDDLAALQSWGGTFRTLAVGDQRATLANLDEKSVRAGLKPFEESKRTLARAILAQRETDEKNDPLGSAPKHYGFQLGKLDWASPVAGDQAARRMVEAESIANARGSAPVYLTRQDRDTLKNIAETDPAGAVAAAQRIAAGFGSKSPRVLREISSEMPSLAYVLRPNNGALAQDWVRATEAERDNVKLPKPDQGALMSIMKDDGYADIFTGRDAEMAKMVNAAAPIIAQRLGPSVTKYDPALSEHVKVAREVLKDMIGRTRDADGRDLGGPVKVNGMGTVAPSAMPADNFRSVLRIITDADLAETGAKPMAGGKPLPAAALSGARWVPAGKDRYNLALGDPRDGAAQWVTQDSGDKLVIDLSPASALRERLKARAPSYFR